MKEMLYIPLFFEKGRTLGFHVETRGRGRYLSHSIFPDAGLDNYYFEQICNRLEQEKADERLERVCEELLFKGQLNENDFEFSYSTLFSCGHGFTREGLVFFVLYGLVPHWNIVAEFIKEFNACDHIYHASKAANRELAEQRREQIGLMPAWNKARMDEGHGQTTDDMPAWKKARMELGQNQDTGAFEPRQ